MDGLVEKVIVGRLEEFGEREGIPVSERMERQFCEYYRLLVEWNEKMNLTAITEPEEVAVKHFADSLTLARVVDGLGDGQRQVIDVGTGAGFPGIPLKIVFPGLKVTLLDSLNKRIRFLEEVCRLLELDGIRALHGRAEDFGRDLDYREKFDLCVSRAVANLSSLSEYCLPFVKVGGCFVSYKSEKAGEELKDAARAIKVLGGEVEDVHEFVLDGADAKRVLIKVRKVRGVGGRYPRKAGVPGKEPIRG